MKGQCQTKGRILLVEDVEPTGEFYSGLLRDLGFDVRGARTAFDALSCVATSEERFDLILINFLLPDMTGDFAIRELVWGGYDFGMIALFTSLSAADPRVIQLRADLGEDAALRFVSKDPGCLLDFLKNPHEDHCYPDPFLLRGPDPTPVFFCQDERIAL